jgi:sugar-specific transcriptional regulator TrmB
MVDVLKADPKFNDKDIMEFMSKVEPQISQDLSDNIGKISTITTEYDDMVRKILEVVEFAQKEILLITRFQNELIVNAILKKANAGINVKVLADTNLVENYFENTTMKEDKNKNEREKVVSNPYYPSRIDRRYVQIPFSAIITDKRHIGLEVVDLSESKKFKMAIFADDARFAESISNTFDGLWQKSMKNHPKIIQKSIKN